MARRKEIDRKKDERNPRGKFVEYWFIITLTLHDVKTEIYKSVSGRVMYRLLHDYIQSTVCTIKNATRL